MRRNQIHHYDPAVHLLHTPIQWDSTYPRKDLSFRRKSHSVLPPTFNTHDFNALELIYKSRLVNIISRVKSQLPKCASAPSHESACWSNSSCVMVTTWNVGKAESALNRRRDHFRMFATISTSPVLPRAPHKCFPFNRSSRHKQFFFSDRPVLVCLRLATKLSSTDVRNLLMMSILFDCSFLSWISEILLLEALLLRGFLILSVRLAYRHYIYVSRIEHYSLRFLIR